MLNSKEKSIFFLTFFDYYSYSVQIMNKTTYKILDCTIRDGGYYTDWNFTDEFVDEYLAACSNSPISIVELGYISNSIDTNGPFYHLEKNLLKKAKKKLGSNRKIFAMINFKEIKTNSDLIKLLDDKVGLIDGVRFAVSPKNLKKFSKIISKVAPKFKKISFNLNLMYLSEWFDKPKIIKSIFNNISNKVNRVAFVDSYGALTPDAISLFMKKINLHYKNKFEYGCHFHNNCGLALANSIVANKNGCKIIDTTFTGMGRGAGNAETELLMSINSQSRKKIKGFELNNFLERLDKLKSEMKWGSSFPYAFAATNGYSQSDMMDLIQKRRLDPSTAIQVISRKKNNEKIIFLNSNKTKILKNLKKSSPILIGGAKSFLSQGSQILKALNKHSPILFSGSSAFNNFLELKIKIKNPKYLILTGSEIKKIKVKLSKKIFKQSSLNGIIAEEIFLPKYLKSVCRDIIVSDSVAENPLMLIGKLLIKSKVKNMRLAFFDGDMATKRDRIVFDETQQSISKLIKQKLNITTITKSAFDLTFQNPWVND
tara:strand:- start:520 stop:2142 length:1623 start_codon:yes stop_codon:yes gene_type:complete